jgi:hypothetical protein
VKKSNLTVDRYSFLKAALDDMLLVSELTKHGIGSARHIVTLLHDAVEFILYESLLAEDEDIYRNGQNTIGLDAAIGLCKARHIDLPLLGTIRAIQKHRGDAKHHAQHPHDAAFAKIVGEFRIIASRLVHERFGQALGVELKDLGLLPYHVALYESYRKYRTHNWNLALRFALGALLHKHRDVLGGVDDYSGGTLRKPEEILALLTAEVANATYPLAPAAAVEALAALPTRITTLVQRAEISQAAETAGQGYARIDGVLPGVFNIKTARRVTENLVQPEHLIITRAMGWSKWNRTDTPGKHQAEAQLRALLERTPALVKEFGPPFCDEDDERRRQWWIFAVFDGTRWETFHLDDHFYLSLETGSSSDREAERRQRTAENILTEFQRAARVQAEAMQCPA